MPFGIFIKQTLNETNLILKTQKLTYIEIDLNPNWFTHYLAQIKIYIDLITILTIVHFILQCKLTVAIDKLYQNKLERVIAVNFSP